MAHKDPPFEITASIISLVTEIAESAGRISATDALSPNLILRRSNRIRTIHSSLAIEQNTLSQDQVTAIIEGKRVLAPAKEIREVQNAYAIYGRLEELDPFSVEDLLSAHGVMMAGLTSESGMFRFRPVGVGDQDGNVLHFGSLPGVVPKLVQELVEWTRDSSLPMLIKSCVFHYELELIHPFSDGNGRMGRLWQTLLLSKWNHVFAWLPVESAIHDRQSEYYAAINRCNEEGSSTAFIEFMLSAIKDTLDAFTTRNEAPAGDEARWSRISAYIEEHGSISNAVVRTMLSVSPATANRILNSFCSQGKLERIHAGRTWAYVMNRQK